MQWADVTTPPKERVLRQFAGLWLLFFVGAAGWRAYNAGPDAQARIFAMLGLVIGGLGLWRPRTMRYIFTGWMIAAFPIGWAISKVMLAALFFLVFTPVAWMFRLIGRDSLLLRRSGGHSYWTKKSSAAKVDDYFRQF